MPAKTTWLCLYSLSLCCCVSVGGCSFGKPSSKSRSLVMASSSPANSAVSSLLRIDSTLPLHPSLAPLEKFLGEWAGEGVGMLRDGTTFRYLEKIEFTHRGTPFISYSQKTWTLPKRSMMEHGSVPGKPRHEEQGYWKHNPEDGSISFFVAQCTNVVEVEQGVFESPTSLSMTSIQCDNSAQVRRVRRSWKFSENFNKLECITSLEFISSPSVFFEHLKVTFEKKPVK